MAFEKRKKDIYSTDAPFIELLKFLKTHLYFSIKHTICQEEIAEIVENLPNYLL